MGLILVEKARRGLHWLEEMGDVGGGNLVDEEGDLVGGEEVAVLNALKPRQVTPPAHFYLRVSRQGEKVLQTQFLHCGWEGFGAFGVPHPAKESLIHYNFQVKRRLLHDAVEEQWILKWHRTIMSRGNYHLLDKEQPDIGFYCQLMWI
ncbi:hypothetical protein Csa_010758 [Cucumis sativus]|uniref:Uncharacterized protein n=1 Tax=Cucumis sativus TaxID=3659 RepID=A0A0A0LCF6_CUCSA|nr:hypothetical protein Csa_010758 [Cucumis sativus]